MPSVAFSSSLISMASSRWLKPGMALIFSNRSSGQHASRNCFHGTQPGTTYPEMCGGGNIAGKLIVVVRRPPAEASDQMVSHCTSVALKKRKCRLTGESIRKKTNHAVLAGRASGHQRG